MKTSFALLLALTLPGPLTCFASEPAPASAALQERLEATEARLTRLEALLLGSGETLPGKGQIRVTVMGEVKLPDVYAITANAPLGVAIGHAGGFTASRPGKVIVERADGQKVMIDARSDKTLRLQEGDIVTVQRRPF